ncbi:MAG: DUF2993 domain-containing protein [Propionibacteriaceae bacterium]
MRNGRRGSGARSGLAFVLVGALLAALVVGGDRLAVALVENQVSRRLQTDLGTPTRPSVDIEGFPFLTQLLRLTLRSVHVVATDVTPTGADTTPLKQVDLRMLGVTTQDRFQTFTAGQVDGTATLDYPTAQRLIGLPVAYAPDGRIEVSIQTRIVSVPVTATIIGVPEVDVDDQTLTVSDPEITVAGVEVPERTSQALLETLLKPVPISGVPFGLKLGDITPTPDGLVAVVTGENVTFSQ